VTARLCAATLERAARSVRRPDYDFSRLRPGLVHLGLGAFQRAHQAVFTEDAILAERGDWGVIGTPIVRDLIKLRYRLIPYLYDLLWRYHCEYEPMVRPTFFDFRTIRAAGPSVTT
jgi:fructuronate reductase